MKLLALLTVGKTKTLYLVGVIISSIYCVGSIYAFLNGHNEAILGMLAAAFGTLSLLFMILDTSRFTTFFLSQKIRLLPIKAGTLYFLNVGLSLINAVLFFLVNFSIMSIAHLVIFHSVDVPHFYLIKPSVSWGLFYLTIFYLLLQFFILLAHTIIQNWFPQLSKAWVPVGFVSLLAIFLLIQAAIFEKVALTSWTSFLIYLVGLVVVAVIVSIWIVARFLEDERV